MQQALYAGGCLAAAVGLTIDGGKSGHRRAGRSLTTTGGDPRDRATENETASSAQAAMARVKWRGKSTPERRATGAARQPPPGARPNRLRFKDCPSLSPATEQRSGLAAQAPRQRGAQMNGRRPRKTGQQNPAYWQPPAILLNGNGMGNRDSGPYLYLAEGGGSRTHQSPVNGDSVVLKTSRATGPYPLPKGASTGGKLKRMRYF